MVSYALSVGYFFDDVTVSELQVVRGGDKLVGVGDVSGRRTPAVADLCEQDRTTPSKTEPHYSCRGTITANPWHPEAQDVLRSYPCAAIIVLQRRQKS